MENQTSIEGVSDLGKKEMPGKTGEALKKFAPVIKENIDRVGNEKEGAWYGKESWSLIVQGEANPNERPFETALTYKEYQSTYIDRVSEDDPESVTGLKVLEALRAVDGEIGTVATGNEGYESGWLFRDIAKIAESIKFLGDNKVDYVTTAMGDIMQKIKANRLAPDEKLQALGPEEEIEAALTMVVGLMTGEKDVVASGINGHERWEERHANKDEEVQKTKTGVVDRKSDDIVVEDRNVKEVKMGDLVFFAVKELKNVNQSEIGEAIAEISSAIEKQLLKEGRLSDDDKQNIKKIVGQTMAQAIEINSIGKKDPKFAIELDELLKVIDAKGEETIVQVKIDEIKQKYGARIPNLEKIVNDYRTRDGIKEGVFDMRVSKKGRMSRPVVLEGGRPIVIESGSAVLPEKEKRDKKAELRGRFGEIMEKRDLLRNELKRNKEEEMGLQQRLLRNEGSLTEDEEAGINNRISQLISEKEVIEVDLARVENEFSQEDVDAVVSEKLAYKGLNFSPEAFMNDPEGYLRQYEDLFVTQLLALIEQQDLPFSQQDFYTLNAIKGMLRLNVSEQQLMRTGRSEQQSKKDVVMVQEKLREMTKIFESARKLHDYGWNARRAASIESFSQGMNILQIKDAAEMFGMEFRVKKDSAEIGDNSDEAYDTVRVADIVLENQQMREFKLAMTHLQMCWDDDKRALLGQRSYADLSASERIKYDEISDKSKWASGYIKQVSDLITAKSEGKKVSFAWDSNGMSFDRIRNLSNGNVTRDEMEGLLQRKIVMDLPKDENGHLIRDQRKGAINSLVNSLESYFELPQAVGDFVNPGDFFRMRVINLENQLLKAARERFVGTESIVQDLDLFGNESIGDISKQLGFEDMRGQSLLSAFGMGLEIPSSEINALNDRVESGKRVDNIPGSFKKYSEMMAAMGMEMRTIVMGKGDNQYVVYEPRLKTDQSAFKLVDEENTENGRNVHKIVNMKQALDAAGVNPGQAIIHLLDHEKKFDAMRAAMVGAGSNFLMDANLDEAIKIAGLFDWFTAKQDQFKSQARRRFLGNVLKFFKYEPSISGRGRLVTRVQRDDQGRVIEGAPVRKEWVVSKAQEAYGDDADKPVLKSDGIRNFVEQKIIGKLLDGDQSRLLVVDALDAYPEPKKKIRKVDAQFVGIDENRSRWFELQENESIENDKNGKKEKLGVVDRLKVRLGKAALSGDKLGGLIKEDMFMDMVVWLDKNWNREAFKKGGKGVAGYSLKTSWEILKLFGKFVADAVNSALK